MYPEGYLESLAAKETAVPVDNCEKKRKKSKHELALERSTHQPKKLKIAFKLDPKVTKFIEEDSSNKKLWDECLKLISEGSQKFLSKVEDMFSCICCQEVVFNPITTVCCHNICKSCLERSFKAQVFNCPMCRQELKKSATQQRNRPLQTTLLALFPGYEAGR